MKKRAFIHYKPGFPISGMGHIEHSYTRNHRYEFVSENGDSWKFNDPDKYDNLEIAHNGPFWIPIIGAIILWINVLAEKRMPIMYHNEWCLWICMHAGASYLVYLLTVILVN